MCMYLVKEEQRMVGWRREDSEMTQVLRLKMLSVIFPSGSLSHPSPLSSSLASDWI